MNKKIFTPELLAPAANPETALAAYDAGADAVYCGLGRFNARERAENFTLDTLSRTLEYAHSHGRKLYLALNTLIKENELPAVMEYLAALNDVAPDALIVQDPGVIRLARNYFPRLRLHASTQMGIHNSAGVAMAARLGLSRVILERQVTLAELELISRDAPVELEVFVHGSLCCSLSGRCLLSDAQGGWSGNRGKCKQPCRRRWLNGDTGGYYLSPGDLNASHLLEDFRRLKIASLKIEGRLRSPDYVWKVSRAYRVLLDHPADPAAAEEAELLLRAAASRRNSTGFYFAPDFSRLIDPQNPGVFGNPVGAVAAVKDGDLLVDAKTRLHLGDRLRIAPPDGGEGESYTLTRLTVGGKPATLLRSPGRCLINGAGKKGYLIYKIGENGCDFSRRAAALPAPRRTLELSLDLSQSCWRVQIADTGGGSWQRTVNFAPAQKHKLSADEAGAEFCRGVPEPWTAKIASARVENDFFVPSSELKKLRREFWDFAAALLAQNAPAPSSGAEALYKFHCGYQAMPAAGGEHGVSTAVPAESRNAFTPEAELKKLGDAVQNCGDKSVAAGAWHELELCLRHHKKFYVSSPLPVCNSQAALLLRELGAESAQIHAELDGESRAELLRKSPLPLTPPPPCVPLLVTRLKIAPANFSDAKGRRYRVERRDGLSYLYAVDAVDFTAIPWQ